jgi:hypothetical protein
VSLALAGLVIIAVLGCGQLPTAPQSAALASAPETSQPASLLGGIVDGLVGLIVQTLNLVGSLGGILSNGRWTVSIPAGAVDGNASVSLGVSTLDSPQCALQISPADKNHFSVPVTLTVDCRNVSSSVLATYVIRWLDPSTGQWVTVAGSKVDLTRKTVSAPLQHFSKYSVGTDGRAGW